MIRIAGLTVQFGGVKPLDDLSAEFGAPIVGLIGPNGAGKTTLLNVFSGFILPHSGSIAVNKRPLDGLSPKQRARLGIRRTFQQEQVVDDLTAWENVQAIADHLVAGHAAHREIRGAFDFVGLDGREDRQGRTLNLFDRRRVEIAKTLIGQPQLILLDEPAAGLDDFETEQLSAVLRRIPESFDTQIVLVDHDADLIASLCHETLVLDFGKRLALGPTREVLDSPVVREAYLGGSVG